MREGRCSSSGARRITAFVGGIGYMNSVVLCSENEGK